MRFVLEPGEYEDEHPIHVRLAPETGGDTIFEVRGAFQVSLREAQSGDDVAATITIPLDGAVLPSDGMYTFGISVGGNPLGAVRFRAYLL
jgi:hypothetical protein